jgi:hypothetical protein
MALLRRISFKQASAQILAALPSFFGTVLALNDFDLRHGPVAALNKGFALLKPNESL